ncbi:MAG: Nucleoside diphosphate kinase A [Cercozoa sp. M6MM]
MPIVELNRITRRPFTIFGFVALYLPFHIAGTLVSQLMDRENLKPKHIWDAEQQWESLKGERELYDKILNVTKPNLNVSSGVVEAAEVPLAGVAGTNAERTFIAIKPDGVQRQLVGEIIARFEKKGYKLVGLKMVQPTLEMAQQHYSDLSDKPFFAGLTKYFSSGPIVCMCFEGKNVIKTGRKLLGETNPLASPIGSIRGDFALDLGRNIIHGSDSVDSAKKELEFWFKEDEVCDYGLCTAQWIYE